MPQTAISQESIASRHARLYDRRSRHSVAESIGRFAAGLLIVGGLAATLWFVAG